MDFFTSKLCLVSSDEEGTTEINEKHSESLNSMDTEIGNIVKCDFETISEHELKVHQEHIVKYVTSKPKHNQILKCMFLLVTSIDAVYVNLNQED